MNFLKVESMEITCAGILVADIIRRFKERAEPGRLVTLQDPIELHVGGCAANTGICLAKMGSNVKIVGRIGDDYWGRFVMETLESYPGIDVEGVSLSAGEETATTDIEVEVKTGERTFYHYVGANANFSINDIPDESYDCRVFHMGGYNLVPSITPSDLRKIFSIAHKKGASTSIDLAWSDRVQWSDLKTSMNQIDYYFSNIGEARMVINDQSATAEELSAAIMRMGPRIVVIKMGKSGCHVRTSRIRIDMPADPQFRAVDGTGAGDAFVAGFLFGLGQNWDIGRTTRFANATGGFCVSKAGATKGVPDKEKIIEFIDKNDLSYSMRDWKSQE